MNVIEVEQVTKDYGKGKGVFDVSFSVKKGEVMGFLGPNGAGKTTTIRQLMGFIHPDRGSVRIQGMDCFIHAADIEKNLGYLPGEIAFMDEMTGTQFVRFQAGMKGMKGISRAEELMEFFELKPEGRIKKMSKGMKQKLGIVCAFMQEPEILILDEPTSGLDPLMQNRFIELINQEKERGKTILMSSHIFEEVERTCDRSVIIREGRIVAVENMKHLRERSHRVFHISFRTEEAAADFVKAVPEGIRKKEKVTVTVSGDIDVLIKKLAKFTVTDIDARRQTLEELFMNYYGEEAEND